VSLMPICRPGDPLLGRFRHRTPLLDGEAAAKVATIIADVSLRGEAAVLESSRAFDCPSLDSLWVSEEELNSAEIPPDDLAALELAIRRIQEFHDTQLGVITEGWDELDHGWAWRTSACERTVRTEQEGISLGPFKVPVPEELKTKKVESGMLGQRLLPLRVAGVYVPGGKASYPSSVLMNVIPAQTAGVEKVIVATPAGPNGKVSPAVLVACRLLGVSDVMKAGGASAAAALAVGISGRPRADILVGPGSIWVNEAKRQLWGSVGLTAYAGPSEVCVALFPGFDPLLAAADLLTQVEHSEDNMGFLVGFSEEDIRGVLDAARVMVDSSARRQSLLTALKDWSCAVICSSEEEAYGVINDFAPEHLALHGEVPAEALASLYTAGCIAIGSWTAQSAGDYISGPSHTLPTGGAARFGSPVNVQDFLRFQTVTLLEKEDIAELSPSIGRLASMEGFPLHALGAQVRNP
jgi:histidinol dehydrogenase